jgi:hypothetical protein
MKLSRLPLLLVLLVGAEPALVQTKSDSAQLPVTRIVLFSSGVGYFQRQGEVQGNAHIDLQFHASNINDLLKSLVLQDQGGGRIGAVSYDNHDPIDKTLKSFGIDLTDHPSLGQLLDQVRGQRVEVRTTGETTADGLIVGLEKKKVPAGKGDVVETEQINLLTSDGLRSFALGDIQRIRFLKPELEEEFRKALEVLAASHDKQKKTVRLDFQGNGKRTVRVGYVTENPMWKTSYRLALNKQNKAFLQGWAIVENTTDEDWHNVRLGLVSGRPISFKMDLYEPLYVPRPVVEPELFASLRPPTYNGGVEPMDGKATMGAGLGAAGIAGIGGGGGLGFAGGGRKPAFNPAGEGLGPDKQEQAAEFLQQGVPSVAIATELGEYFKYEIEHPVDLPRQKSALLPIVNARVEATNVSIYNEGVHAKFPLLGLRFKNTTGLHLMQGPITVFEADTYAGDAHIMDLQPNETRLVSYAVDLGTEVAPEEPAPADSLVAVKVYKGVIHASHKVRHAPVSTVKNRSEHDRLVLIEHPYVAGWNLVAPAKPAERARDVYRFEVKTIPNQSVKLEVVQEEQRIDKISLGKCDEGTFRLFLRAGASSAKVKEALEQALKQREELAQTQHEMEKVEQALLVIDKDQARMRANMGRVPPTSEAYKRYLKKFDEQETEIEKRRAEIAKLQESADKQRKEYESFVANLNLE